MLPRVFYDSLFDDFFPDPFEMPMRPPRGGHGPHGGKRPWDVMKTDIKDAGDHYEMAIDLPGFKKEDVQLKLENGYMTVSAVKNEERDDKGENGQYIRRERWNGRCSRSFYVGDAVRPQDVSAKFEDGILCLTLPKAAPQELPEKNIIVIE